MTRKGWGGVMIGALLISGGSGYYVFSQIKKKDVLAFSSPVAPMRPTVPSPQAEQPKVELPTSIEEPKKEIPLKSTPTTKESTRNILFKLPKPTATAVYIVGDFNAWKRQALVKKEKAWEISIPLVPGSYKYMYVIDERRVRDPSNKQVSDGKSVITVKSLTEQK
jgi:hypothetical protein